MRILSLVILVALLAVPLAVGCNSGPAIPSEELGELQFDAPKVPGIEEPYQLPESQAKPPKDAPI
jgi:hypothetical protein